MAKRHSDAIAISDGACNPSGIAHSIIDACWEIRDEKGGTHQMYIDPAIRLMVYQLGFLVGFPESGMSRATKGEPSSDWFDWRDACKKVKEC